jgi:hypothetical protein
LTLCVVFYDLVAPRKAVLFYHVNGETVLELLLIALWLTSFAGMASYVSQISPLVNTLTDYTSGQQSDSQDPDTVAAANSKSSEDSCVAIVILGAVMLYVIHLLYFLSSLRNIHSIPPLITV